MQRGQLEILSVKPSDTLRTARLAAKTYLEQVGVVVAKMVVIENLVEIQLHPHRLDRDQFMQLVR